MLLPRRGFVLSAPACLHPCSQCRGWRSPRLSIARLCIVFRLGFNSNANAGFYFYLLRSLHVLAKYQADTFLPSLSEHIDCLIDKPVSLNSPQSLIILGTLTWFGILEDVLSVHIRWNIYLSCVSL